MFQSDFQLGVSRIRPGIVSKSAGGPQGPDWDAVDRLPGMASNPEENSATPGMNNTLRKYVPAAPSQPSAEAPQDLDWDAVDRLLSM